MKNLGLKPLETDPCVYFAKLGKHLMIIVVYADGMLMASNYREWMLKMKQNLMGISPMTGLGEVNHCLGMEFARNGKKLQMMQKLYVKSLSDRFEMRDSKPVPHWIHNTCYTREHWVAVKRVLCYLRGTLDSGITFSKSGKEIEGYVDADCGSCSEYRRYYTGYTGYAFILAVASVSWEAK